jgi:hypothetical protein
VKTAGKKRSSPEDSRKGRGLISNHYNEGAVNKCYSKVIIIIVISRIIDVNIEFSTSKTDRWVSTNSRQVQNKIRFSLFAK